MIFPKVPGAEKALPAPKRASVKKPKIIEALKPIRRNGLMFDIPQQGEPLPEAKSAKESKPKAEKVKRACDPRLVSAARELRDRWLEQVNATPLIGAGKYDVSRRIEFGNGEVVGPLRIASTIVESHPALPAPVAA